MTAVEISNPFCSLPDNYKEFFENGAAAFEQKRPTNHSADQERIAYLQKKIQTKDEVLAELMAEHVALKKDIGEL